MSYVEREYEVEDRKLYFDTRGAIERFSDWLQYPQNWKKLFIGLAVASLLLPFLFNVLFLILIISSALYVLQDFELPFRVPMDLGGLDPSDPVPGTENQPGRAGGIFYLGVERSINPFRKGREVWLTNSDDRMHKLVLGTTGAGKTRKLLGYLFNAVAWGSGGTLCDGKGDSDLVANVQRQLRMVGREHDLLVMNFLRGGRDQFVDMVRREQGVILLNKTNSFNPLGEAGADMQTQLSTSLLPKAEGDSKSWQDKAINMFDGIVRLLCYMRARGEIEQISFEVYREYLALPKLCEIFRRAETDPTGRNAGLPPLAYQPIKSYLTTGLPGFNAENAKNGKPQTNDANTQHGYLTGQFARTLGLMCDTYGDVFKARFSEINMRDVALNNRFLVIVLPALEKSPQEISNLGRLAVAAAKLMMAQLLGDEIEGTHQEVVESKVSKGPTPLEMLWDEVGCYFSDGFGSMVAQGRSIGTSQTLAGQDLAAMGKGGNEAEVEVVVANTKVKEVMASEDPAKTFDLVSKLAGQATVSRRSGDEMNPGVLGSSYRTMQNIGIEKVDRVTMRELKGNQAGHSIGMFLDRLVRIKSFDPISEIDEITDKLHKKGKSLAYPYRINRFVEVVPPTASDIEPFCDAKAQFSRALGVSSYLRGFKPFQYPQGRDPFSDPILNDLRTFAAAVPDRVGAMERGIVLFEEFDRLLSAQEHHHTAEDAAITAPEGPAGTGEMPAAPAPMGSDAMADDYTADYLNEAIPLAEKNVGQIGHAPDLEALLAGAGISAPPRSHLAGDAMGHAESHGGSRERDNSWLAASMEYRDPSTVKGLSDPKPAAVSPLIDPAACAGTEVMPDGLEALLGGITAPQVAPTPEARLEAMMTPSAAVMTPPAAVPAPMSMQTDPPRKDANDGLALGFADAALQTLYEIEQLSGNPDPVSSVCESEMDVAKNLTFEPSPGAIDAIDDDGMAALFNRLDSALGKGGRT